ncbi:MAG: toll/interleukin-1 receptor domain-containing protein [Candidatus Paceibacterota bacterium]
MLVNRAGFRIFNDYDLGATLDAQLSSIKKDIEIDIKSSHPENNTDYIARQLDKYKIQPLIFDQDNLTVTTSEKMIQAEYFGSGFFVEPGKSYSKEVLSFHLSFSGDEKLLHCVPSTRILWTEEVILENNEIVFDVINFSNDADKIKSEKDKVLKYLIDQAGYINTQVNQYNTNLEKFIKDAIGATLGKITQQSDLLSKIGVPLKNTRTVRLAPESIEKASTSRVITKKTKEFDVFICHASEDKSFVEKLAEALKKANIEVWYDDFQLGWGDDLRPVIDNGLKNSRYGLVIFSKSFLAKKKWTEYELNGLFAKEKQGIKVILPIWHDITRDDIAQYSPSLADRLAKSSSSIKEIISELNKLLG